MTNKTLLLFLIFLVSISSFSQNDTIVDYIDKAKNKFVEKDKASFIRKIIEKNQNYQVLYYTIEGNLVSDETFSDEKLTYEVGNHKFYHDNGNLQLSKSYNAQSKLNGDFQTFYEDGSVNFGGLYKDGKKDGEWNYHYTNGIKIARLVYKEGEVQDYSLWNRDGTEKKEKLILERRPKYQGGQKAMANFIRKNLAPRFKKSAFKGRLILRFTINKEGRPENIDIHPKNLSQDDVKSIHSFFAEMPNWEPGIQLNRKVKVKYTLPVRIN